MRRAALIVLTGVAAGCATSARPSRGPVAVYEARASAPAAARRLPEACRSLGSLPAADLTDAERYGDDPYRRQRRETEARGGNVLLAVSETLVNRPNTNCPSSDRSPDCLRGGNSWYRISFESFACSPEAVAKLAATPSEEPGGPLTWNLAPARIRASDLKAKLLEMKAEDVSAGVMAAYARGQRLRRPLTAEEIVDWKRAGIPDAVIEAAVAH